MALDSKEIPLGGTEPAFGLFFDVLKQARLGLLSIIPAQYDGHVTGVTKGELVCRLAYASQGRFTLILRGLGTFLTNLSIPIHRWRSI